MNNDDSILYCEICKLWLKYNSISDLKEHLNPKHLFNLVHCPLCHNIWDGNAQCMCENIFSD